MTKVAIADLFCGAGGSSEGSVQAARELGFDVELVAVNHSPVAVATHKRNHPEARHYLSDVRAVKPREAVPSGHLDLLLAGAPCPHFSVARGSKPVDDYERSTPKEILRWPRDLEVDSVLIENVREFQTWGPLIQKTDEHGRLMTDPKTGKPWMIPDPARMSETYRWFLGEFAKMGYLVEARVLNAADYGAATIRKRLFIMARKGRRPEWPSPTHCQDTWRSAREVIDWSLEGRSIFGRKKPLAKNTLRRIAVGIERFCGEWAEPFLVMLYGTGATRSLDRPVPTITAGGSKGKGGNIALCQFVLQQQSGGVARDVDRPIPAVATRGAQSLIEACLVPFYGERPGQEPRVHSVDDPVPTVVGTGGGKFAKIDFIVKYFGTGVPHTLDEPAPTVTTKDRVGLVECEADGYRLDIRLRMLQPHELASAMSFPDTYRFEGNRSEQVRQIGNAWDVNLGKALCKKLLAG